MNIYEIIDMELKERGLVGETSVVLEPKPIEILDMCDHAKERCQDRNATMEMAQHYVDTAVVMIKESKDKYEFISKDGSSVVLEFGLLVTVIPRANYTFKQMKKMQVILWQLESCRM